MTRAVVLPAMLAAMAALAFSQGQPPAATVPPAVVPAPVASPPPALPTRIATIFAQNAIVSTQEGQKAAAALAAKYDPKRRDFESKQAALQALRDRLKRGAATMSAAAKGELNQTIDARYTELKRLGEDIQSQVDEEQGTLLQTLGEKLVGVIEQFALDNGLAIVLDVSPQQSPVLWAAPGIDITSDIVRLYDKAHPVAAGPAVPLAPARKQ
ncbi:MAG: OmpH family outer membrane protein [Bryobacteraceae bacterium]|jgi:outer membrane protein